MNRPLPRRVTWADAADEHHYNIVESRGDHLCDHFGTRQRPMAIGACVGRIRPGDLYLSAKDGWRERILFRCAVAAGIVIDTRLTPPLAETLLCAAGGILLWSPDLADPVRIRGDDGEARFNPVAQAATRWLVRHELVAVPETAPFRLEPITITLHGRYEVAAIRAQAVRKMRP